MAYSDALAGRIRKTLENQAGVVEKKMFGGLCFMIHGNMACGVSEDKLMLRLGNNIVEEALAEPHTEPMDFTGRTMKSMMWVLPEGIETKNALQQWIDKAVEFAISLPPK
jgi:TfoX/Sxy family transcriptional regulator of competence genes